MAEKYLLAMDGSELSKKAAEKAVTLMKGSVATLDVVVVASDTGIPVGWASDLPNLIMEARMEEARKIVADAQDFFKKKGIEVDPVIKVGHPAQEICKFARLCSIAWSMRRVAWTS